jgi:CRISPR-associated endoribonuclease Cas6
MDEVGVLARVRVDVAASGPVIKWPDVHGSARAVMYGAIGASEPDLARELHDQGWRGSSFKPVGISPPLFIGAAPRKGTYTTSANGSVWFGSPVPEIASAILKGLSSIDELRWGSVSLKVLGKELEWPDDYESGTAEFSSVSPVLVKKDSRFLLPKDSGYLDRLTHNLRHKADFLGIPSAEVKVELLEAGPKRNFEVGGAMRIGANVRLRVTADPALLRALYEWGIGLNTVQGFGWLK